jgi:hypothetical protein
MCKLQDQLYEIWDTDILNYYDNLDYVDRKDIAWIQFKKSRLRDWIRNNTTGEEYQINMILFIRLLQLLDRKKHRKYISLLWNDLKKYNEKQYFIKRTNFKVIII